VSIILYIAWLYSDVKANVKVGSKIKSLLHLYTSETNLQNLSIFVALCVQIMIFYYVPPCELLDV
jgi:hypothetical protein